MKTLHVSGLERNYRRNFLIGLAASLFLVWMAFEWTTEGPPAYYLEGEDLMQLSDEIEVVRTAHSRSQMPPPPRVVSVSSSVIEPLAEPFYGFEPTFLTDTNSLFDPGEPVYGTAGSAPVMPPPPKPVVQEVEAPLIIAEIMPRFPGCEDRAMSKDERKACSDQALLDFIYARLEYPAVALENGITGKVIVRFVVEKDGSITNMQVVRDIGGGCGQAVLEVVEMMPKWIPGSQQGRKVRVLFNLPVRFQAKSF
jgi:protein TonB